MTPAVLLMVVATVLGGNQRVLPVVCGVRAEPGVDGYVYLGVGPVHLRRRLCVDLAGSEDRYAAYAVLVLGHEVGHYVLNTMSEMRAECWGLAHVKAIARVLHWNPDRTYRDARWSTFCA